MQVRPAGQAGYPISLVASLDTVPVKCCVPLHTWQENLVEPTTKAQNKQKEVLHLCRWSTHTLAQKNLIELLMWSASIVHRQSSKV